MSRRSMSRGLLHHSLLSAARTVVQRYCRFCSDTPSELMKLFSGKRVGIPAFLSNPGTRYRNLWWVSLLDFALESEE